MQLAELQALGFDESHACVAPGYLRPLCSQCEALVINGVPCHETGCPNARERRECDECGSVFVADSIQQSTCGHTCFVAYNGLDCNCDECGPFDDDEDFDL